MVKSIIKIKAKKVKKGYSIENEAIELKSEKVTENFLCNVASILFKIIKNDVEEVEIIA